MIKEITWGEILPVWQKQLWPNRVSAIEERSVMKLGGGYHTLDYDYSPYFYGYYRSGILCGVNSCHQCPDSTVRSRGLWVYPEYRGVGIGVELLKHTIEYAKTIDGKIVWSLPRQTSWSTYKHAGFTLSSEWFATETSDKNAYCQLML